MHNFFAEFVRTIYCENSTSVHITNAVFVRNLINGKNLQIQTLKLMLNNVISPNMNLMVMHSIPLRRRSSAHVDHARHAYPSNVASEASELRLWGRRECCTAIRRPILRHHPEFGKFWIGALVRSSRERGKGCYCAAAFFRSSRRRSHSADRAA